MHRRDTYWASPSSCGNTGKISSVTFFLDGTRTSSGLEDMILLPGAILWGGAGVLLYNFHSGERLHSPIVQRQPEDHQNQIPWFSRVK
jgi:hypothetical protein